MFIDKDLNFLAASPDGLVDDGEGLVGAKCLSAFMCEEERIVTDPVLAFTTFVADLRNKPGFFGSGKCLLVAAEPFNDQIILHQQNDPCITVIPNTGKYDAVINILFRGIEEKHYDSVVQINGSGVWFVTKPITFDSLHSNNNQNNCILGNK